MVITVTRNSSRPTQALFTVALTGGSDDRVAAAAEVKAEDAIPGVIQTRAGTALTPRIYRADTRNRKRDAASVWLIKNGFLITVVLRCLLTSVDNCC